MKVGFAMNTVTHPCLRTVSVCNDDISYIGNKIVFNTTVTFINNDPTCDGSTYQIVAGTVFEPGERLEKKAIKLKYTSPNGVPIMVDEEVTSSFQFTSSHPTLMPKLAEWHIYGNGVQGKFATRFPEKNIYYLQDLENDIQKRKFAKFFGIKTYEVKDHLGNIRTLLTDVKKPNVIYNKPAFPFTAEVKNRSEYYPFGWEINLTSSIYNSYRYSYNGTHLKDNEISGNGNHFDFGGYGLDPRIGRRWNLDPVLHEWQSDYSVFGNNPIVFADPSGLNHEPSPIDPGGDDDNEKSNDNDKPDASYPESDGKDTKLETPTEQKQEVQRNDDPPKLPNIEQAGQLAVNGQKSNKNTSTNQAFTNVPSSFYFDPSSDVTIEEIKIGVKVYPYFRFVVGAIVTGFITFMTPTEMGHDDQFRFHFVYEEQTPEIYKLTEQAFKEGKPVILTYNGSKNTQTKQNRKDALKDFSETQSGYSRDEYPYASTIEGGKYAKVGLVPVGEQSIQGGQLSGLYRTMKAGQRFIVVLVPKKH